MEGALNKAGWLFKLRPKKDETQLMKNEIMEELNRITLKIKEVENLFDITYDPDMTEAYVYELRALDVKYNSVLKRARQNGISAENYPGNPIL